MPADIEGLLADPRFQALPEERKRALLARAQSAAPATPQRSTQDIGAEVMSPEFQAARERGEQAGAAEAAGPIMGMLGMSALGPGGPLRALGTTGRVLTHPVTVGTTIAGARMAGGTPPLRAAGEGAFAAMVGGARVAKAGRRFQDLMRRSAERFGRAPAVAEEAGALAVPGRTLTKPSAPPFLPKGKMRLDLGPTEQTTMTGTVGTSRPPTPKPVFSSTGATPRGRVSQPNVSVRAGTMDPAKQGPATAPGKVTPRNTPAGEKSPLESKLETSLGRGQEFEEATARVKEMIRDTNWDKATITKKLAEEIGATPGQARTLVDVIFARSGLTRKVTLP